MSQNDASEVPVFQDYMNPLLAVLRRAGRPLGIEEMDRLVVEEMKLPPEVVAVPHEAEKPDRSEVSYRLAWARTYLKKAGFLENEARGQWRLSEKGRTGGSIDARQVAADIVRDTKAEGAVQAAGTGQEPAGLAGEELHAARVGLEVATQIRAAHDRLGASGELLPSDVAARCYARFRERFGPDVLARLDGEALLQTMHGRGDRESLAYWLEFKDDKELPARFGSILGGSALKFGLYFAKETGQWMTGNPRQQRRMTLDEAVTEVRAQRDELVAGARVLAQLPATPTAVDYTSLQAAVAAAAPTLADSAWGHKYFSMLAPHLLEPFHGADYQAHHLRKMLKLPLPGRYENARVFAGVAAQLGLSMLDLAAALVARNGAPHAYWRIGTTVDDVSEWDRMLAGGFAAVGWGAVGSLEELPRDAAGREDLRARIERHHPSAAAGAVTKAANQVFRFLDTAQEGDVIVAMEGAEVRGVGKLVGAYRFVPDDGPLPHRRNVEWQTSRAWKLPEQEGLRTTFVPIRKDANIVEIEARLLGPTQASSGVAAVRASSVRPRLQPLTGRLARVEAILQRKRQVILYGPPGTGKTYLAAQAVEELAARGWYGLPWADLDEAQRSELRREGATELCAFHPAYGYEDFLEGFRPTVTAGTVAFELRPGVFKRLCERAATKPSKPFFLIIDEINRGDIPRIFGELLTVLERDKRGKSITLPLSGTQFAVPENVYVIGTMNTADRSIALLDAALRRRFGFVELLPDTALLGSAWVGGLPLGAWLEELNMRILRHAGRDVRHLQVGHSYLMHGGVPVRDVAKFAEILRDDIVPLLEEYCYESADALEKILGSTILPKGKGRIDGELFEPPRHLDLIEALLVAFPSMATTKQAVEAGPPSELDDADESEDGPP